MDLSPAARELDAELGWSRALSSTSSLRFGIVRAFDAGNVAGARDVAGFPLLGGPVTAAQHTARSQERETRMNRRLIFTTTLVAIAGTTAHAQEADRGAQNRAAVRKLFPVVTLFDRKPAAPTTPVAPNRPVKATGVAGDSFGASAPDVARIRAMDVAGVRLGMSPDQARAALRASGYAPTPDRSSYTDGRPTVSRNYDYATFVEQARRGRLAAGRPHEVHGDHRLGGTGTRATSGCTSPTCPFARASRWPTCSTSSRRAASIGSASDRT